MAPSLASDTLQPRDEHDICEAVSQAVTSGEALEIVGGGSKQGIGAPGRKTRQLSTGSLARVIDYDPAELVLTLEPGVCLVDIEALLADNSQMLAFEPWDFAETTGATPGRSTIGGVVGSGLAGSRRISAGSVRDHMLGFTAVNGRGELFKAGGRVVKNVTGYDLPKLMAGSWGRLAILTQITLKVMPRPRESRTLVLLGLDAATAVRAMTRAMGSPAEIAATAWAPGKQGSVTMLRLEGFGPSVDARAELLRGLLAAFGAVEMVRGDAATLWRDMRNAVQLDREHGPMLWRIVAPPARGAGLVTGIEKVGGVAMMDWAGGLVWARTPTTVGAADIRKLAEAADGHAMLSDAPEDMRRTVPTLHPEPAGVAALSRRVRQAFDPASVFDPERFEAGAA